MIDSLRLVCAIRANRAQNLNKLESQLALVSTPGSPQYGQYQDLDSQNAMFAPSTDAVNKVKSWLSKSGAINIVSDGVTVNFDSSVAKANQMMNAAFKLYTDGQTTKLRTMSYSVPEDLAQHIDIISPTTYFGEMKAQAVLLGEEKRPTLTSPGMPPEEASACTPRPHGTRNPPSIPTYLSEHMSPAAKNSYSSNKFVDFTGRAIPDIAAHSLYPD